MFERDSLGINFFARGQVTEGEVIEDKGLALVVEAGDGDGGAVPGVLLIGVGEGGVALGEVVEEV